MVIGVRQAGRIISEIVDVQSPLRFPENNAEKERNSGCKCLVEKQKTKPGATPVS